MWRAGKHNYRNICVCVVQRYTASLNDYLHTLNICSVYLLNVIYFSVFLKLLCTTPCYCTPCVMSSLLSFQISLSILPVVFLLSALLSRSNAVPSIFSPHLPPSLSLLLQSSCHLSPHKLHLRSCWFQMQILFKPVTCCHTHCERNGRK